MDKRLKRSILQIIVFTILLIFLIVNFSGVSELFGKAVSVLTPLFVGFGIAFVLHQPCAFFQRMLVKTPLRRAAVPMAVVLSYLTLVVVLVVLVSFVVPQIAANTALFVENLNTYVLHAQVWINQLIAKLDLTFLESLDLPSLGNVIKDVLANVANVVSDLSVQVLSITSNLVGAVVTFVMGFVFSVYMLSGRERLLRQCRQMVTAYLPQRVAEVVLSVARLSAGTFTKFVSGQLLEACILSSLCFIGMCIFRFEYAPLISVIVGISALVPIVGAYLGAITSALLLAMISPIRALWFLLFLISLQQIEGNVIYPRVVGTSIGLPGIWVLTAVTVGGGLFGFIGLLVAVPVASVLYTITRDDLRRRLNEQKTPKIKN